MGRVLCSPCEAAGLTALVELTSVFSVSKVENRRETRRRTGNMAIDRSARLNAERREVILEAARNIFDEKGLQSSSIRAIAKEAGCTTGAIYPYFKGKEEIYAEILGRSLIELQKHIERESRNNPNREGRFLAFLDFYIDRPTDFALGIYLYENSGAVGLGKELNAELNELLVGAVKLVTNGDKRADGCGAEEALVLASLMGIIVTFHSRRMSLFGADMPEVAALACRKLFHDR